MWFRKKKNVVQPDPRPLDFPFYPRAKVINDAYRAIVYRGGVESDVDKLKKMIEKYKMDISKFPENVRLCLELRRLIGDYSDCHQIAAEIEKIYLTRESVTGKTE